MESTPYVGSTRYARDRSRVPEKLETPISVLQILRLIVPPAVGNLTRSLHSRIALAI